VTAAGAGTRFGGGVPKQFGMLGGKPVLQWSVDLLSELMPVAVSVPPGFPWRDHWTPPPGVMVVPGGARRQDSVLAALGALDSPRYVLVHDGARPGLTRETILRVMRAVEEHGAAIPGVRVRDTLKLVQDGMVSSTVERRDLWMIQTPQGFLYDDLCRVLSSAPEVTDESSAMELAGVAVAVVGGDPRNLKLTEPSDMSCFACPARLSFGQGLDFHPFREGRPMMAAG